MKRKIGFLKFLFLLALPLILIALAVIIIDPFFHYHKGINGFSYVLSEERYQNDGIVKHFSYDALISGSSETQNFKSSDFDRLWGTNAIKTSFPGGSFKEVDGLMRTALESQKNIKYVLRSLDVNLINFEPDQTVYEDYPYYLYDKNPFNDYQYWFNKEVLLKSGNVLLRSIKKQPATSFDDYGSFYQYNEFGKEAVFNTFSRLEVSDEPASHLSQEDKDRIRANIEQNVIETAKAYPDVTFYYFVPPFCICYWDGLIRSNQYDYVMETEQLAIELMLEVENIKVYSFAHLIDITSNLDNYMDTMHYSEVISSKLLEYIHDGEGLLTKDNYLDNLAKEREIYKNYDYSLIFDE